MKTKLTIAVGLVLILISCNKVESESIKLIPVMAGESYQYVDREGKIIINPQFSAASIFRDGVALVRTTGDTPKWGFINDEGKYLINPTFKSATIFSEDMAWVVTDNGAPTAINKKGETQFSLKDAQQVRVFSEGLAAFSKQDSIGEKWGFVDKSGKIKISTQFATAGNFADGKSFVKNEDNKYGYIDTSGKLIINHQFDGAGSFSNGMATVILKDKAGVIDSSGKYIINPQFSDITIDGDLFLIEQDKKYGWCDKKGKIIINPQFDEAYRFGDNDLAAVKVGESFGYVDKEGKIVVNPQFDIAFPLNNNMALVSSGDKFGFVDSEGKYLINPQFDNISYDLAWYIINGSTLYGSVETDFFDVSPIIESINFSAPDGLSFNSTISQILLKFKKSKDDISQYEGQPQIYNGKKIGNDATLEMSIVGSPFKSVEDGWSYQKVYDPTFKSEGFIYSISLSDKGAGKGAVVRTAFEQKAKGLAVVKSGMIGDVVVKVYKDATKYVVLASTENNVNVYLIKSSFDISGYLSKIQSDGESTVATEVTNDYEVAPETTDTMAISTESYE